MSRRIRPDKTKMDKWTRKRYERSCEIKNAYPTAACALIHCFDMYKESQNDLWAYECEFCKQFHAGHASGAGVSREKMEQVIESLAEAWA